MNNQLLVTSLLVVSVLSGCTNQPAKEPAPANVDKTEVELVPARKDEEESSRKIVVEEDGKFYEMLKEHERLCHDCDR